MGGNFNPFQSKQAEVVRTHAVANRKKARKIFDKLQRKRPYVWAEIQDITDLGAEQTLNELNGETSVALFVDAISDQSAATMATPILDALITRLWENFNKLHIIQRVESGEGGASEDKEE